MNVPCYAFTISLYSNTGSIDGEEMGEEKGEGAAEGLMPVLGPVRRILA